MADKEEQKKTEEKKKTEDQPAQKKTGLITWIIMAVIIVTLTGTGYVVGKLFAGSSAPAQQQQPVEKAAPKETAPKEKKEKKEAPKEGSKEGEKSEASAGPNETWYYDLDPIVANLNEPGAMRYIRVSITLQISDTWPKEEAESILEMQKPNLRSSLAIYLASLTTDDATGDKNLRRIQLQILDTFNNILFPDSKPQIKQILFKEGLAIQ